MLLVSSSLFCIFRVKKTKLLLVRDKFRVQPYRSCNNKYMIASTQTTNTGIFAFTAVLVFKLLGRKVLFLNRKDNRNC